MSHIVTPLADDLNSPELPNANVLALLLEELKVCALATKLFKSKVPEVKVKVLVDPIVKSLDSVLVPDPAAMVIGKSNNLPFVSIVFVPLGDNVVPIVPEVKVPPDAGIVKLPYNVLVSLTKVPVKPVKSKSLKFPINPTVSDEAPITMPVDPEVLTS